MPVLYATKVARHEQMFGTACGVVTLSLIERNWPITAKAEAWDFNDLACCSIAEIRLIALNVATPVEEQLAHDPVSGQLFVFVKKKRDKIKIPYWERAGFCLWRKRLERERFKWPDHLLGNVLTLDGQQLNWLLDGYDLAAMRPHRSLAYTTVL
jgi:transposase